MENKKTIYIANLKEFGNFGNLQGRIYLERIPDEIIEEDNKGEKFVSIIIKKKKETDQYGQTHVIVWNDWKPDPNYKKGDNKTDLPF